MRLYRLVGRNQQCAGAADYSPEASLRIRARAFIFLCLTLAAPLAADELSTRLTDIERSYSIEEARALLEYQRPLAAESSTTQRLAYVRSLLLLSELLRIRFEELKDAEPALRREIGREIDIHASEGLAELETLDESSEKYRMQADLYATMIRSDFQAKKYRKKMEAASSRALELDPSNSRALVSLAKPYVFAKPNRGGDPLEAIEILNQALELSPELEPALLLRALAFEKLGRAQEARADYQHVLSNNPECRPAQKALESGG